MKFFREALLKWHKKNNRSYPWREETSPYKIMIAEFMLQRTRADQVASVYSSFLRQYPDVKSLSEADIDDVKQLLKPLGLFWRAMHFIKAANYIKVNFKSRYPSIKEELLTIPGIGDYAAGAILAVSFKKPSPIVDSNIARVLNRYMGLELTGEIRRKKEIIEVSSELFNYKTPKKVLFAIIDFGAIVCTPVNPKHENCPVKASCLYYIYKVVEKQD